MIRISLSQLHLLWALGSGKLQVPFYMLYYVIQNNFELVACGGV